MSENMEQSPQISSLPEELILDIIARVPISHYPTLSQVSKSFRNLIGSPQLHKLRSVLGFKEHRVYAAYAFRTHRTRDSSFNLLHRKLDGNKRFVHVRSVPPMTYNESYVAVGPKVYAFSPNVSAYSIDCKTHTVQRIPDIPLDMHKVVHVVDGKKIHVIGGWYHVDELGQDIDDELKEWNKAVMVFDTETQSWEPPLVNEDMPVTPVWIDSVVMEGKIYLRGYHNRDSIVYEPKERKWELMDEKLNSHRWKGACVVDKVLYYHNCYTSVLWAYDPKENNWSVVNGLEGCLVDKTAEAERSQAVNYGEKKLALVFTKLYDINFCAEITLERRQGGGIWGKMESCYIVDDDEELYMLKCVAVTV